METSKKIKILAFVGKILLGLGLFYLAFEKPTKTPYFIVYLAYMRFMATEKYTKMSDEELRKHWISFARPIIVIAILSLIIVSFFFKEYGDSVSIFFLSIFLSAFFFSEGTGWMKEVMANRIPEKIHRLSHSSLPPFMRVGKRYAIIHSFTDHRYWNNQPLDEIWILREINHNNKNNYFFVRTDSDLTLPRDFEIREEHTVGEDGKSDVHFIFDNKWM